MVEHHDRAMLNVVKPSLSWYKSDQKTWKVFLCNIAMRSSIVKFFVHSQLDIVIFEKRAVHRFAENSDASPRPLTSAEEAQIRQKTFVSCQREVFWIDPK